MNRNLEKKRLFDDDSEAEEESFSLNTNKDYAKKFNSLREKELYKKLKEQDLEKSGSDSSDSSSEDEDANDPKFDEEFFKTLSSLKSKDPKIYDKDSKFFNQSSSSDEEEDGSKAKKQKPLTLNDYERKVIVEKGGKYVDDDEESEEERPHVNRFKDQDLTYVEEQNKLKQEFSKALNEEDSDDEFGGIFKKRSKSKAEKDKEEAEFSEWLSGRKGDEALGDDGVKKTLAPLKEYWNKPTLTSREKFLRDYILTKGYADADADEIPTYEEIIGEKEEDEKFSADEDELEKQAEFEQKYNFRYEEPDDDFIKRYPRTIEHSVRKEDTKRKQKRQETKDRKLQEKEEKMKQIEMLKELKRKEIQEKIDKLKMVAGQDEIPFNPDELDEDFDPEAHDKRMQELFNDEYYQIDEGEEKPDCDIDELKFEDWDNYDPTEDKEDVHCDDEDFNMDCDFDPKAAAEARKKSLQEELIENTIKKKRGRRNRFTEMLKQKKPVFDPEDEKTYGDYIDEYYKMDCEDIIGDTQCRFKYTECEPNDFGLTIEEILLAKNKELNQWASLKKAVQIRPDHLEKKEQRLYKLKAKNEELKKKIFRSLYDPSSDEEEEPKKTTEVTLGGWEVTTTNKKKKKKKKASTITSTITSEETNGNSEPSSNVTSVKVSETPVDKKATVKRKAEPQKSDSKSFKKQKPNEEKTKPQNKNFNNKKPQNKNPFSKEGTATNGVSDDRLKAYGINPKKFHNQQKFGKNGQVNQQKQQQKNIQAKKPNNQIKKKQSNGENQAKSKKSKWD